MRFKLVIDWHDEDENISIKNSDDKEIDCIINITYPINKKFDAKEINKIIYNYLRKNLNSSSCDFIIKKLSELSPDFIRDAYLLCLITDKNRDLDLMFKNIHDYNKTGDIVYPLTLDGYYEALTDSSCKSLFFVEGNSELITIDEFKKTIDYISEVVRKIKRHNLSPLEEIIYAYDISKNRIYLEEEHDERKSKSRDITKVLFGDKIVCTGFASVFTTLVRNLGYQSTNYIVEYGAHELSVVRVKDEKYNLDLITYFDPTGDSLGKKNCYSLNSYNWCGNFNALERYDGDITFGYENLAEDAKIMSYLSHKRLPHNRLRMGQFFNIHQFYLKNNKYVDDFVWPELDSDMIKFINNFKSFKFIKERYAIIDKIDKIDNIILIKAIYNARCAMAKDDVFNATFTDEDFKEIVSDLNYHQQSNSFSEITNTDFLNLIKNKVTNKVKVYK